MSPRDCSHDPPTLKSLIEYCSPLQHRENSMRLKKLKTQE